MKKTTLLFLALLGLLTACGNDEGKGPDGCVHPPPQVGKKAHYIGTTGLGKFPDASVDYAGTIKTVFDNNTAEVEWPQTGETTVAGFSNLAWETTCAADRVGKRVSYTGTVGVGRFKDASKDYFGSVVTVFTENLYQVTWDDIAEVSVHGESNLSFQK